MKKLLTILSFIFLSLIIIPTVKAEGNYIEIKMYEKKTALDFTDLENAATNFLFSKGILRCDEGVELESKRGCYYNDELVFYIKPDQESIVVFEMLDNITPEDNTKYDFTEEELMLIEESESPQVLIPKDEDPLAHTILHFGQLQAGSLSLDSYYYMFKDYVGIKLLFSEKCENNGVCITSTSLDDKTDSVIVNNNPTVDGLSVSFDVTLKDVNDQIKYKIIVRNDTSEDVKLNISNFKKSDYIKYEYTFEDGNSTIKAGTNKVLFVTIKYDKEVPEDVLENGFVENNVLILSTKDNDSISNPKTGQLNLLVIFSIAVVLSVACYILVDQKSTKISLSVLIITLMLPFVIKAATEVTIKVNTKVEIAGGTVLEARYDADDYDENGNLLGSAHLKDFWAYGIYSISIDPSNRQITEYAYRFDVSEAKDQSIIAYLIKKENFENTYDVIITSNKKIYANPDSRYWFAGIDKRRINGLKYLDTSKVTNMEGMFRDYPAEAACDSLNDNSIIRTVAELIVLDLSNFDTRNVTNMSYMFEDIELLDTIIVGELWNTDKVTKSSKMFGNCIRLRGQNGTIYDGEHIDKEYARIDKEGIPGYLSDSTQEFVF